MTIQIPNVGTGVPADQTGDSPWLAMKKVSENFSNNTHAASRLVGGAAGDLMAVGAFGFGSDYKNMHESYALNAPSEEMKKTQMVGFGDTAAVNYGSGFSWGSGKANYSIVGSYISIAAPFFASSSDSTTAPNTPERAATVKYGQFLVTNYNAKADSNGFYKAASPTIDVYADKIIANDEAKEQNPTFKRNGIGDYTITTVSGLSTDGWYLELPKDLNGNPKVAVTLSEVEGVITLKSYKRIFSMETFNFVPDLDNPLDIPHGRWIDLRLNEIPVEMPDDTQTEV